MKPRNRLTLASVRKQLSDVGIMIWKVNEEYRIFPKSMKHNGPKTYYTDDLEDALSTGLLMAIDPSERFKVSRQ